VETGGGSLEIGAWLTAEPGALEENADHLEAEFAKAPHLAELILPALASGRDALVANARHLLTLFDETALLTIARGFEVDDATARSEILGVLWAHLIGMVADDRAAWLEAVAPYLRPGLEDERVPHRGYAEPEVVEMEHDYRVCDDTYLLLNRLLDSEFDDSRFRVLEENERGDVVRQFSRRFDNLLGSPIVAARKSAQGPGAIQEITIVAKFPDPYGGQDTQEERDKSTQSKWAPSTRDFLAVAKADTPDPSKAIFEVSTFMEMVSAVLFTRPSQPDKSPFRPRQSIKRLNVITHGNPGLIAMSGTVDKSGTVMLHTRGPGADDLSGPIDVTAVQAAANPLLLLANGSGLTQSLRDRFAPDAEVFIYACHSGMGGSLPLIQDLCGLLKVKIKGYKKEIAYCPSIDATHILDRAFTAIGDCNLGSTRGFKHLVPDIVVNAAATPSKPGAS
jgi:hypothetical protein